VDAGYFEPLPVFAPPAPVFEPIASVDAGYFEPAPVFAPPVPVFEPIASVDAGYFEPPPVFAPPPPPVFAPAPSSRRWSPRRLRPILEPRPVFEPVSEPVVELLPEPPAPIFEPIASVDAGYFEPLPVFAPVLEPVVELLPEPPAPVFEPIASVDAGYFEPLPVFAPVPEPVAELLPPPELPLELLPQTIEPPGVLNMEDFFTAEDYTFPVWEVGSVDEGFFFDFDSVEPIPSFDAGDWFVGPMPLADFPAIDEDVTWTAPVEAGAVEDLITVGDIGVVTFDEVANYVGTGGAVEVRDFARPATETGATVVEMIKDATSAMVAALGLVQAYRALTSKPAPNPVAQARQGQNTIRANPDGTITTTTPTGQTRTARPPVGQPQMTTDGTMIVNNGDDTYTRIGRDGASVVNRYPLDITERFGAAVSSPYTLPLLLAGGAALVLFSTRRR
jgi:hypothetical protein